ncbi:MAG TPA: hypothetical protein EYP21_06455 [Syntrophaceae bacterium]|nr:hypothetical protein [Syntrophaceae bacterium]
MGIEIMRSRILVVEGKDEELFFSGLINHLGLAENLQVLGIGGKDKLRRNLKALKSAPNFAQVVSLGLVRDADENPAAALQSVRDALQAENLPAPMHPMEPVGNSPQVTIMILPDESTPGMLEDLCLRAVARDPAMHCVVQYFQCLQDRDLIFLPHKMSKAKVHVFLASRSEPDRRLGEAAKAGYWPWDNEAFEQVKKFLKLLVRTD